MASPTATGNLLAGRYRVQERIGSGGMATVYLAEDERLGRRVAVKRLHAGSPEETAQRFAREARIGASLNHENVVTVFDTVTEDESVVIVMEYVDGESLADALRRGRIEPQRAVSILRGVAAALDHAHTNGIIHRDVKPANILLGRGGTVKLVDLGIATAVEGTHITRTGSVMGTAAYMAPEQLDGQEAGPGTDVYALAAVAYEMLGGRPAYRGGSPVEVAHQVVSGPPPDLSEAWPQAPRPAVDAISTAMAFRPGERPASASAFVDGLADALREPERGPDPPTSALPPSRTFERARAGAVAQARDAAAQPRAAAAASAVTPARPQLHATACPARGRARRRCARAAAARRWRRRRRRHRRQRRQHGRAAPRGTRPAPRGARAAATGRSGGRTGSRARSRGGRRRPVVGRRVRLPDPRAIGHFRRRGRAPAAQGRRDARIRSRGRRQGARALRRGVHAGHRRARVPVRALRAWARGCDCPAGPRTRFRCSSCA